MPLGSNMSSTKVETRTVNSEEVSSQILKLRDKIVEKITDEYSDRNPKNVPSALALGRFSDAVEGVLNLFANDLSAIKLTPVISEPIIRPYFLYDDFWVHEGSVIFSQGIATYTNLEDIVGPNQAYIKAKPQSFISDGVHFFAIEVSEITTGVIDVVVEGGEVIKTIHNVGIHTFERNVIDPEITEFRLRFSNVQRGDKITVKSASIHHVKTVTDQYMTHKVDLISSGGSGFASEDYVQINLNNLSQSLTTLINSLVGSTNQDLQNHINAGGNPHGVSPETIGAALVDHLHEIDDIDQLSSILEGLTSSLNSHLSAQNPHNVSPESIGAARDDHSHSLEGLGAAPVDHEHSIDSIQGLDIALTEVTDGLDTHLSAQNPHSITKMTVGLGNVEDFSIASDTESRAGNRSDRYATPESIRLFVEEYTNTPGAEPIKLTPRKIYHLSFDNVSDLKSVGLIKGRKYFLKINSKPQTRTFDKLGIFIGATLPSESIIANSVSYGDLDTGQIMWIYSEDPYVKLVPGSKGFNYGAGSFLLDTTTWELTGTLRCMSVGTDLDFDQIEHPVTINAGVKTTHLVELEDEVLLSFYSQDNSPMDVDIEVYEFINPGYSGDSLIVDAQPVGTVITGYFAQAPAGYLELDGSELNRADYYALFDLARELPGLLITEDDWQTLSTQGTDVDYFSEGDGVNTFRIPRVISTGRQYVKAEPSVIKNGQQLVYNAVWE